MADWHPWLLSLRVTAVATLIILLIGIPLSYALARLRFPGKTVLEVLLLLPLVLPPTVVGYYLIRALGRGGPFVDYLGIRLLFTWEGAVVAAAVMGLPLMVQVSKAAIASVDPAYEQAAKTLGSSSLAVFWRVTLPLARRGLLAGTILASARALGDFGATLMVAGNIPARTQTAPLAIYDLVQQNRLGEANLMVGILSALAFASLWLAYRLGEPARARRLASRL